MKLLIALLAITLISGCLRKTNIEENEAKLTLDQVPPAVRDSLKREAQGAPITHVEKEDQGGQILYETEVTINGKNYEIKVDPEGKLISRKAD
jgi:hypothetical protein